MKKRDLIIGIVVLALLAALIYSFRSRKKLQVPEETPLPQTQKTIEEKFNLTIPEDVEKVSLKAVGEFEGVAIATRKYEKGKFTHTVLADLPDPEPGRFYEGWLIRGRKEDPDFDFISTGKMKIAKGGYILEFESGVDYSNYSNVAVTLEKIEDNKPETHILEGSF